MSSQGRAQTWFDEASFDLETARILSDTGRFNACVFYCQQAAEKAMKSVLLRLRLNPWGHSVWNLYVNAAEVSGLFEPQVERAAKGLDMHYIPSRYPDGLPSSTAPSEFYDQDKATEALSWASTIIEYVRKQV